MASDPRPTSFVRHVDGVEGAPEEDVKPTGVIVYDYPRLPIVVEFALEQLREFSPVATGRYRDSHTIYLDGQPVENLSGWQAGMEVVIANPLPYARRIEVGHMHMQVDGTSQVYEQAVSATNRRFSSVAKALFTYRGIVAGVGNAAAPETLKGWHRTAGNRSYNRYPAIIFKER